MPLTRAVHKVCAANFHRVSQKHEWNVPELPGACSPG